jgi:Abortive infection alpha
MNEPPDPTGGWAKATEEASKAVQESTRAARDLGRFVRGPMSEVLGMMTDHLQVVRFERGIRLAERVRTFMEARGLRGPTRQLPLNIALPLLGAATLEENDELQDVWAMLLSNAGDASAYIDMRRAFVSILGELIALDVKVLTTIAAASKDEMNALWTCELPDCALPIQAGQQRPLPSEDVQVSLGNLMRVGCVIAIASFGVPSTYPLCGSRRLAKLSSGRARLRSPLRLLGSNRSRLALGA